MIRTVMRRKQIAGLTESRLQLYDREKQFVMNFTMFIIYSYNAKIQSDSYSGSVCKNPHNQPKISESDRLQINSCKNVENAV